MALTKLTSIAVMVLVFGTAVRNAGARARKPQDAAAQQAAIKPAADSAADFEYYRAHVEPIFLKKRATHGRCEVCHATGAAPGGFGLQPLSKDSATWTEEQSRRNYEVVKRLIAPGDPTSSALLLHPLAPEAGGDGFHGGGWQFASQDDPDWQAIAAWVKQTSAPEYTNLKIVQPTGLGRTMHSFNLALGEECSFCHVADFASDANPTKGTARQMIQMTRQINAGGAAVTCYTCHRGERIPRIAPPMNVAP